MGLKKTIKFSSNWNRKLDNHIFTTIRKPGFWVNQGDYVVVVLNDRFYKHGKCISKRMLKISEVPIEVIVCDTGYELSPALKILTNFGFDCENDGTYIELLTIKTMPERDMLSREIAIQTKIDM